jgi:hypothetical protein
MSVAGSIEATRELCADLDNLIELTKEGRAPIRALSLIERAREDLQAYPEEIERASSARAESEEPTKAPGEFEPPKPITKAESDARKAFRQGDAEEAILSTRLQRRHFLPTGSGSRPSGCRRRPPGRRLRRSEGRPPVIMVLRQARSAISQPIRQISVTLFPLHGNFRRRTLLCGVKEGREWQRPYFRCRICGTGRWQKSGSNRAARTFRESRSIASRISTLRIIGRYVYHLRARLMPTRPPVRRYMSKAFCGAIMI